MKANWILQIRSPGSEIGFGEFKNTTNSKLAELRSMLASAEHSLSTCSDDVTTLQRNVKRLTELTEHPHYKCEDLEGRSHRNNVRIVGSPESPGSCSTSTVSALLKDAWLTDRTYHCSQLHTEGNRPGLS